MVGQVHHSVPVRDGPVADSQGAVFQGVSDFHMEIARKALLPVRGIVDERDAVLPAGIGPQLLVKAHGAAVELVFPLIFRQAIVYTVQIKGRAADAVCVAADKRALKVGAKVFLERGVAKHDIAELTGLVRC